MAWSQDQLRNAATIVRVGREMGMTTRDIQIGLITAMVESNLVNVNYGDRDSLGLFQQRPSQGWGSPEQVTDPIYASRKFFDALRGLGDRRYQMPMGDAAQAVQRSAFPDRYGERIASMRALWPQIQGVAGEVPQNLDGGPYNASAPRTEYDPGSGMELVVGPTQDPIVPQTPSAAEMLGAWGMGTAGGNTMLAEATLPLTQSAPEIMPEELMEATTFIGPSTNTVITEIQQETGGFTKGLDGWRQAVVSAANNSLGIPYVWGGTNLASGVDCSGFVQAIFAKAGINLPRVSYQQANYGQRVGIKDLRAGDLVAWDNSSRNNGADHIAIYLGNGRIAESPRPGSVTRVRQLGPNEGAWGVRIKG